MRLGLEGSDLEQEVPPGAEEAMAEHEREAEDDLDSEEEDEEGGAAPQVWGHVLATSGHVSGFNPLNM